MDSAKEWFQSTFFPNNPPSYRGSELRRQSTVDKSLRPALNPQHSMVLSKGLINKPGQNNCFLNSAVQILWHNDVFRRSFRQFEGHTCDGDPCIFCALKVLFTQFQHGGQVAALPPDALRIAMSNCYENLNRFQLGLMDDAAECFEKILEQIHFNLTGTNNLDSCSIPWCVSHEKFALTTVEQNVCYCKAQFEPSPFVEFVHYITTSLLVKHSLKLKSEKRMNSFDSAMNMAGSCVEGLTCHNYPHCQRTPYMRRILLNSPDVICIGFIWDSEAPPISFIMNVVEAIDTEIRPANLFNKVASDSMKDAVFTLSAMITYYGKHYSTYCYHTHRQEWIYFDDAKFRKVGKQWSTVVEECRKSRFQPLLLVFSNPNGVLIDTSNAPTAVTMSTSTPTKSDNSETPPPPPVHKRPTDVPISTATSSSHHQPSPFQSTNGKPAGDTKPMPSYVNTTSSTENDGQSSGEYSVVRTNRSVVNNVSSSVSDHPYVNQSTPGYTTHALDQNTDKKQPMYDDVINNQQSRNHHPKIQKQEKPICNDEEDLIQFSITPANLSKVQQAPATDNRSQPSNTQPQPRSSTSQPQPRSSTSQPQSHNTQFPAGPTAGGMITGNPFMLHDSKNKPSPMMPSSVGSQQPPATSSSSGYSKPMSQTNTTPSGSSNTFIYRLESQIRGLPKNIRDAICHGGACLRRANHTNDPVMCAILLDSALTRIHSVINHPSVTACPELQRHLTERKDALQSKLSKLMPELDKARSDPLSLRAVLLPDDDKDSSTSPQPTGNDSKYSGRSTATSNSRLTQCIECNNRRFCDDTCLCGPCRLKLRLHTTN